MPAQARDPHSHAIPARASIEISGDRCTLERHEEKVMPQRRRGKRAPIPEPVPRVGMVCFVTRAPAGAQSSTALQLGVWRCARVIGRQPARSCHWKPAAACVTPTTPIRNQPTGLPPYTIEGMECCACNETLLWLHAWRGGLACAARRLPPHGPAERGGTLTGIGLRRGKHCFGTLAAPSNPH